jgi:hypothetical protein
MQSMKGMKNPPRLRKPLRAAEKLQEKLVHTPTTIDGFQKFIILHLQTPT